MTDDPTPGEKPHLNPDTPHATPERVISETARQALLEAAERRGMADAETPPAEHGGPTGPEPTRYGDWEKKGLAVDF